MPDFEKEINLRLLGARLREARLEQHLTLDDVADACDVTSVHLRHLESGVRMPSIQTFILLCKTLKVSPTYFLYDYIKSSLTDGLPDAYERYLEMLLKLPPRQAEMVVAMMQTMVGYLDHDV